MSNFLARSPLFGPVRLALATGFVLSLTACHEQTATVVINAPIEAVWAYTGKAAKAADWSVFFDHISPLPGIPEGQVGALRRCYRHADETGLTWDEATVSVQAPTFRQIRTFNIRNSPIPGMETVAFHVYHRLRALGPNRTELTFASSVANWRQVRIQPSYWRMVFQSGNEAARIVQLNVENIKALVEAEVHGTAPRLHRFMDQDQPLFDLPKTANQAFHPENSF
jgi:hypothetical protein